MFLKTNHTVGLKASLNKFRKAEIYPACFSDHKEMKLFINIRIQRAEHTQSHTNETTHH